MTQSNPKESKLTDDPDEEALADWLALLDQLQEADDAQRKELLLDPRLSNPKLRTLAEVLAPGMLSDLEADPNPQFSPTIDSDSAKGSVVEIGRHSTAPPVPSKIDEYTILGQLGAGGMGVVYEAFDAELERKVAIKRIHPERFSDVRARNRFLQEAKSVAKLDHEGIIQVSRVSHADHSPYLVMEFVDGHDLAEIIRESVADFPDGETIAERARYIEQVCRATAHAHDRGIVHRDIKPGNVLIRNSDQQSKLADFGLAKSLATDSGMTGDGSVLGTPNFGSPEQLLVREGTVDHRSDVYSLGATLYHAFTGQLPYGQGDFETVLARIRDGHAIKPANEINEAIPPDLATVCAKAMQPDPDDRYQSADELGDDINRALNHLPIKARRITWIDRSRKWARRHPARATMIAVATGLSFISAWMFATRPAYLLVSITPPGSRLSIDGEPTLLSGEERLLTLSPGSKTIDAQADGYEAVSLPIELSRGRGNQQNLNLRLIRMAGRIEVSSEPIDARVIIRSIDGDELDRGQTPYLSRLLPAGPVEIEINKPLYKPISIVESVPNDSQTETLTSVTLEERFERTFGSVRLAERIRALPVPFEEVNLVKATISEVALRATQSSGADVLVNDSALKKINLSRETEITTRFDSLASLMRGLRPFGLTLTSTGWLRSDGQANARKHAWQITTQENSERTLLSGIYSLEELRLKTPINILPRFITRNVQPSMWDFLGGVCTCSVVPGHEAVLVAAPVSVHDQVAEYLQGLSEFSKSDVDRKFESTDLWTQRFKVGETRALDPSVKLNITQAGPPILVGERAVRAMEFIDNDELITGDDSGAIIRWNLTDSTEIQRYENEGGSGHSSDVSALVVADQPAVDSTGSRHFYVGNERGRVMKFDLQQSKPLAFEHRHQGRVTTLALSPDQTTLLSGGVDGYVIKFKLDPFGLIKFNRNYDPVTDITFVDDESFVYTKQNNRQMTLAKTEDLTAFDRQDINDTSVQFCWLPPQQTELDAKAKRRTFRHRPELARRLLLLGRSGSTWWISRDKLVPMKTFADSPSPVWSIAYLPRHNLIATLHFHGQVVFRNPDTLDPVTAIRPSVAYANLPVAVSPDESTLIVSGWQYVNETWQSKLYRYQLD